MWYLPTGAILQRLGVVPQTRSTSSRPREMPSSCAMAGRCSSELVEPPIAMSSARALRNARFVIIASGAVSSFTSATTASPVSLAIRSLSGSTAGMVPFSGRDMPRASERQFMLLAVNSPAQHPGPGQAHRSMSSSSSSVMLSDAAASITFMRSTSTWRWLPASIGPPETIAAGTPILATAISMPGMTLSQLGIMTTPSSACPSTIISTDHEMTSREGSENFMPP